MKYSTNKLIAVLLAVALLFTGTPSLSVSAQAQGSGEACAYSEGADCAHEHSGECAEGCIHTEHDGDCGYIEAAPCDHERNKDCGGLSRAQLGSSVPVATSAITAFVPLGYSEKTVPLGTSQEDIGLPDALEAETEDAAAPPTSRWSGRANRPMTAIHPATTGLRQTRRGMLLPTVWTGPPSP
jgi:hypothetical protein